jgi:hypothetical protein
MFICIGTYSVNNSAFDVWLVVLFGALGYLMRILDFPAAPLLLGFVLGPMMEEHFRRAMRLSRGDFMIFFDRPISAVVMALSSRCWRGGCFRPCASGAGSRCRNPADSRSVGENMVDGINIYGSQQQRLDRTKERIDGTRCDPVRMLRARRAAA